MSIETMHVLKLDGAPEWRVTNQLLRTVGDEIFIKLRAYDMGFIRMVCHGVIDLPKRNYKLSIAQCDGYKALIGLRQNKANQTTQALGRDALAGSASLGDRSRTKRPKRVNASKLQELREDPQVMELEIPAIDGRPPVLISCVRPCHPCDELTVKLCPDTLGQVVLYMRSVGIGEDTITARRGYRDEQAPDGAWKMGSAGYVMRVKDEGKKYKSLKPRTESPARAIADAESHGGSESPVRELRKE